MLCKSLSFSLVRARSVVAPARRGSTAPLQELGQAAPQEGEDLAALKGRLAAGAAEALEQQLRWAAGAGTRRWRMHTCMCLRMCCIAPAATGLCCTHACMHA